MLVLHVLYLKILDLKRYYIKYEKPMLSNTVMKSQISDCKPVNEEVKEPIHIAKKKQTHQARTLKSLK